MAGGHEASRRRDGDRPRPNRASIANKEVLGQQAPGAVGGLAVKGRQRSIGRKAAGKRGIRSRYGLNRRTCALVVKEGSVQDTCKKLSLDYNQADKKGFL